MFRLFVEPLEMYPVKIRLFLAVAGIWLGISTRSVISESREWLLSLMTPAKEGPVKQ